MTSQERKELLSELVECNMTKEQLVKYLEGPMTLSPKEWIELVQDIKKDGQEDNEDQDPDEGKTSDADMNELLDEKFPKEPEPKE